jgi:hypothetical protein
LTLNDRRGYRYLVLIGNFPIRNGQAERQRRNWCSLRVTGHRVRARSSGVGLTRRPAPGPATDPADGDPLHGRRTVLRLPGGMSPRPPGESPRSVREKSEFSRTDRADSGSPRLLITSAARVPQAPLAPAARRLGVSVARSRRRLPPPGHNDVRVAEPVPPTAHGNGDHRPDAAGRVAEAQVTTEGGRSRTGMGTEPFDAQRHGREPGAGRRQLPEAGQASAPTTVPPRTATNRSGRMVMITRTSASRIG